MEFFDIVTKKTYTKDGVEKSVWMNCGKLRKLDDGKQFLELAMFPNTSFYIFEQKKKEGNPVDWNA